jgi:UDP-glucose 4-epimerase
MSTYLVTGGCGFIGSHLVDSLLADGHDVRVLDDLSTGKRDNLDARAKLTVGSITDRALVAKLMAGAAGCFHLAAVASVERCNQEWVDTHTVNLTGTIAIFDAARAKGGGAPVPVVYASSAAIYGDNPNMPLSESAIATPLSAYGADKYGCELHARVAAVVHGVPTTGLRFFNVYGPRQDPKSPYSGVISIFCDKIFAGAPVTVFGDGGQVRDFVYVGDVVRALRAAMATRKTPQNVFNVCTGTRITVRELAETIYRLRQATPNIVFAAPRSGDIRVSCGDPTQAQRELGFKSMTSLSDGLAVTLDHLARGARASA